MDSALDTQPSVPVSVQVCGKPVLLSDAAIAAGINLDLRCGGNGICRGCIVEWEGRRVMACQTLATHDGLMQIPVASLLHENLAVESAFTPPVPRTANPRCKRAVVEVPLPREMPGVDDWERVCRAAFRTATVRERSLPLADARGSDTPRISHELLRKLPRLLAGFPEGGPPVLVPDESRKSLRLTILDNEVIEIEAFVAQPPSAVTNGAHTAEGGCATPHTAEGGCATPPEKPVAGLAIDVGTTTVVVRLVDLANGAQLALAGTRNRQASLGANVISRISQAASPHGLELLQKLVCEKTILPLLERCLVQAGLRGSAIRRAVIGGNTVMTHLFLGLPVDGLGAVPFNAVSLVPGPVSGTMLGLPVEQVECLPAAGAYIGGDALGGVYAVGLDRPGPPELLIDFGTNSEMLLRVGDKLFAASAAAGPAFEGGGLSCGGPAAPGAITHIKFDHGFQVETYQNTKPTHLCGSAYIDFLAEGRKHGFLSEQGRFSADYPSRDREGAVKPLADARGSEKGRRCMLAPGVGIDEHDLSLLLQAKAAVLSGAQILLRSGGIAPGQLNALHVAGGFGKHLNAANALRAALLPRAPLERIKVVGNTSLAACSCALLNSHAYGEMCEFARRIQVIELNLEPDYEECYINALSL